MNEQTGMWQIEAFTPAPPGWRLVFRENGEPDGRLVEYPLPGWLTLARVYLDLNHHGAEVEYTEREVVAGMSQ